MTSTASWESLLRLENKRRSSSAQQPQLARGPQRPMFHVEHRPLRQVSCAESSNILIAAELRRIIVEHSAAAPIPIDGG